ncbi:MAG: hypothetical protein BroJett003_13580 [Planctomycetota bacterium]|nr:MAG: hypothetical protein BroJett003_13580 [Planctomycetota bacterium]
MGAALVGVEIRLAESENGARTVGRDDGVADTVESHEIVDREGPRRGGRRVLRKRTRENNQGQHYGRRDT